LAALMALCVVVAMSLLGTSNVLNDFGRQYLEFNAKQTRSSASVMSTLGTLTAQADMNVTLAHIDDASAIPDVTNGQDDLDSDVSKHPNTSLEPSKHLDSTLTGNEAVSEAPLIGTSGRDSTRPAQLTSSVQVKDFEKQPGVVVATKVHGPEYFNQLKQMYCLFSAAYNWKMQYDIILFHTEPIPEQEKQELIDVVSPANISFYVDGPSIQEQVKDLNVNQTAYLTERCHVNSTDELTWRSRCFEKGGGEMPLAYTWQCEFRSKHIWQHPGLKPYKYMLWLDSDAMCGKAWQQDPIATMIRNDLVLMFANFPQGQARGAAIQDRIQRSFNKTLCDIVLVDGHFEPQYGDCWRNTSIGGVHGFMHLTNLDFFRSPPVKRWTDILIGDGKFSRKFDDQIAVAVPPAILAPNRSWDMWQNGINLTVIHNGFIDGKLKWRGGFFKNYWRRQGKTFPEAFDKCVINDGGRRRL
jgi:hypothetical protein